MDPTPAAAKVAPASRTARRRRVWLAVAALVAAAAVLVTARSLLSESGLPADVAVWRLSSRIEVLATDRATITVSTPQDTEHARVFREEIQHPGLAVLRSPARAQRAWVARAPAPGFYVIHTEHLLAVSRASQASPATRPERLQPRQRAALLAPAQHLPVTHPDVARVVTALTSTPSHDGGVAQAIADYLATQVRPSLDARFAEVASILKTGLGTELGRARTAVTLARRAEIPARLVWGLNLQPRRFPVAHHWAELYVDGRWLSLVPGARAGDLPRTFVPLRRGGEEPPVEVRGGSLVRYLQRADFEPGGATAHIGAAHSGLALLDLTRLPLDARNVLAVLLMLPVGALVTVWFRRMLGLRSYGTFTPTLLAMALTYVDPVTATTMCLLVGILGIGGRAVLAALGVTRSARLPIVFTIVIIGMATTVSVLSAFDPNPGAVVLLLPVVVLTGLIDRLYSVADEDGLPVALSRLAWTALITAVTALLFLQVDIGHWLVAQPEAHLLTLAAILALGQIRGRTLAERLGLSRTVRGEPGG